MNENSEQIKPELLSLILKKSFWKANKNKVIKEMFEPPLDKLYKSIEAFHEQYQEDLDKDKLWEIIKVDHPTLTLAQKMDIKTVLDGVRDLGTWSEEFGNKILTAVWKEQVFTMVAKYGIDGAQGKIKDLEGLKEILDKHGSDFIPKDSFMECSSGIDELIEQESTGTKWGFQLKSLHDKLGGMSAGHFLQLMARPDCGKTAFLVSCVAAPGGWADQGAVIDWYANEEPVKRTRWRCISAFTGLTKDKLIEHKDEATLLWEKLRSKVRTIEIPFGTPVERIAARTRDRKPDIVIVDQLDKLGVRPLAGEFAGETDRIRLLYIKFREIAKQHNCLVVGVCQASADAEGHTIVTYDMAENSKTGKAAECDVFLGIGRRALKDGMLEEDYTRWITCSKNKLDTGWKGVITSKLQPTISRFEV